MGCGDHGVSSGCSQFTCHCSRSAGIEARSNDTVVRELLTLFRASSHSGTTVTAERALLHRLEGDARFLSRRMPCSRARPDAGWLWWPRSMDDVLFGHRIQGLASNAHHLGTTLAERLLADGADVIPGNLRTGIMAATTRAGRVFLVGGRPG